MMADYRVLPKMQSLHQKFDRDCGVCVFAKLAGMTEEGLRAELPDAHLGTVTVNGWEEWLRDKGFIVTQRDGCPNDIVPCAHLVSHGANTGEDYHWVYRDEDGDVLDPNPVNFYMPPGDARMRRLDVYSVKVLTISISR
jgi:hypothetical protein